MCCQQSDARGLGHADSHTRFFVAASLALLRRHNILHTMHLGTGDGYSGLWGVGEIPEVELLLPARRSHQTRADLLLPDLPTPTGLPVFELTSRPSTPNGVVECCQRGMPGTRSSA